MSVSVARDALRAATAPAHADLENTPINRRLFEDDFSAAELADLLGRFVTVYRPLEAVLRRSEIASSLAYEPRLPLLMAGLDSLKASAPSLDLAVPFLPDPPSRIGALYVVEGSTMGGQLIHRHLMLKYPPKVLGFFLPHGERTAERWRSFLAELETHLMQPAALDAAKLGAIETFRMFHRALTA
jgi:heme oxygenase